MGNQNKDMKFNSRLAYLWRSKKGNYTSMKIDAKSFDQWHKATEEGLAIGSVILLKVFSEESRSKMRNPDKAPHAVLEIMSKESVEQFENENPRKHTKKEESGAFDD